MALFCLCFSEVFFVEKDCSYINKYFIVLTFATRKGLFSQTLFGILFRV